MGMRDSDGPCRRTFHPTMLDGQDGDTAAIWAARQGDDECLKVLANADANLNARDWVTNER